MTGEDLKRWRSLRKMSQQEAANAIGCSRMSIANWEGGRKIPHYIAMTCSAIALDIKPWPWPHSTS